MSLTNSGRLTVLTIGLSFLVVMMVRCDRAEIPDDIAFEMSKLPSQLDYNIHVKPILSDRCFACHGPDKNKQKANLRLDLPEGYEKNCESGRQAIVGGNLYKSDVFHRIVSNDPEVVMPTPQSHLTLTPIEKAILLKWIKQGAQWKEHWSLTRIEKQKVPTITDEKWVRNNIDCFVLKKLEEKDMKPNQEADKTTLLRRVSLDLTGLPPTIQEQEDFVADKSSSAYEKVVDRLLQSPHFGEYLASNWLDLARYADTRGYQSDPYQNVYPYRDWVIAAFNGNLSYSNFVKWQLAGDLLPNPTREQRLATCFLRLHPQNIETGIIPEEYRTEYVIDRVNTFGKAFLAHSVECARCHDHKYDPISQKDFYQIYAFFNNNKEIGEVAHIGEPSPAMTLITASANDSLQKILGFIASLQKTPVEPFLDFKDRLPGENRMDAVQNGLDNALIACHLFNDTVSEQRKGKLKLVKGILKSGGSENIQFMKGKFEKSLVLKGEVSVDFKGKLMMDRYQPFGMSIWINLLSNKTKGILLGTTMNGMIDAYRGYCLELNEDHTLSVIFSHSYPANAIELRSQEKLTHQQWHHVVINYDGSSKADGIQLFVNGKKMPMVVLNNHLERSLLYTFGENYLLKGFESFRIGSRVQASIKEVSVDDFYAFDRPLAELEVQYLLGNRESVNACLNSPACTPKQADLLAEWYRLSFDPSYKQLQGELKKWRSEENKIMSTKEEVMVYEEMPTPRNTFILNRGAYDAWGMQVLPDVPHSLPPLDKTLPRNRLGLADWLLSEDHPLFARVTVNRYWQLIFGRGLVNSSDDFGNQGDLPTHPELLDWLADGFRKNWDTKALIKMLVMSATYRQSSIPSNTSLAKDPDNVLLGRFPTNRMSAEIIRDNALAASGLLNRKVGGKSVKPYQPAGIWEALGNGNALNSTYVQDHGSDLYRRSLYTYWKRNAPNPSMVNFDSPDRFTCTIKRQKTSTPLQALVTLNDPQFFEAARVLAQQALAKGPGDAEIINYMVQSVVSRKARAEEIILLSKMHTEMKQSYSENPLKVKKILSVGEYPVDPALSPVEVASWALVANTVLNFDEALIKR